MKKTQKNKSTEGHLGLLKAKLAKLRAQLIEEESKSSGGGGGEGFDVARSGDGRVAMVGFPSVGKSTLLSKLTGTKSEAAAYEFTTLTCIPGKIEYAGATVRPRACTSCSCCCSDRVSHMLSAFSLYRYNSSICRVSSRVQPRDVGVVRR